MNNLKVYLTLVLCVMSILSGQWEYIYIISHLYLLNASIIHSINAREVDGIGSWLESKIWGTSSFTSEDISSESKPTRAEHRSSKLLSFEISIPSMDIGIPSGEANFADNVSNWDWVRSFLKQDSTSSLHWSAFTPVIKNDEAIVTNVPATNTIANNIELVIFFDIILLNI